MQRRIQAASGNSPAQALQGNTWTYLEIPDDMGRGTVNVAKVLADTVAELDFPYEGGSRFTLNVRECQQYGRNVYIKIFNGQLNMVGSSKRIAVEFDEGKIEYFSFVSSELGSGSESMFVQGFDRMVKRIKASKTMIV